MPPSTPAGGPPGRLLLVTSALPVSLPADATVRALTAGCVPDPEGGGGIDPLPDPFADAALSVPTYHEIRRLTDALIAVLSPRLNRLHGTTHPERHWRLHIGIWAVLYVSVIVERARRLSLAAADHPGAAVVVVADAPLGPPGDTIGFANAAKDDRFNNALYGALARRLGLPLLAQPGGERDAATAQPATTTPESALRRLRTLVARGADGLIERVLVRHAEVVLFSPYLPKRMLIALAAASRGRILPARGRPGALAASDRIDDAARQALAAVPPGTEEPMATILALAGHHLPRVFVEDYAALDRAADDAYGGAVPRAIYSANAWWYDEAFKHWAAGCAAKGTVLIGGEHSTSVYYDRDVLFGSVEIAATDRYLSWGWDDPADPRILPVPANKLTGLQPRRHAGGESILYVTTAQPRHNIGMLDCFAVHLDWQQRYFRHLPERLQPRTLVRTHYADYGWGIRPRLARTAPGVRFDDWSTPFGQRLDDARLCVFDYLSTTFAEAMARDVPCVIFWNQAVLPLRAEVEPVFRLLREARVLHDTPESAADWVAEVEADPGPWWRGDTCRRAVAAFCTRYARTSATPMRDWQVALDRILGERPKS